MMDQSPQNPTATTPQLLTSSSATKPPAAQTTQPMQLFGARGEENGQDVLKPVQLDPSGAILVRIVATDTTAIDSGRLANAGGDVGAVPVLFSRFAVTATAGTYKIATMQRKMRIVDWWIVSRDTTASNAKLKNGSTDMTADVAKGMADVTRVQGAAIITAQQDVASGTDLNLVTSGNASLDVFVWAVPVA